MAQRKNFLQAAGSRSGVDPLHDRAELAGELPVPGYVCAITSSSRCK